jgi:NAD(P)-dependent dehydrogenase (short-subunit alcohol dehydrogenase family)
MGTILVTGSTDGIGARIAAILAQRGHRVIRHARSVDRASSGDFVIGDFTSLDSTRAMAGQVAAFHELDVVVHNAGWAPTSATRPVTADGLEQTFQVNALAAYLLQTLIPVPRRLVFISSDSIRRANLDLDDLQHTKQWSASAAYADSKFAMTAIAFAFARRHPGVPCNAVHPGWIRTKMSGDQAPLDVDAGADTPVWLATSDDPAALVSGVLFHDRRPVRFNEAAYDTALQDALMQHCAALTAPIAD